MDALALRGRWALVTGASSGLGEAFARRLAARGTNLVLTARSGARLAALAEELGAAHGVATHVLVRDLCEPGAALALGREVAARGVFVEHLVNNAGAGLAGDFLGDPAEQHAAMVRLNCEALVVLSRAMLPAMVAQRRGGVIHVASVAGLSPNPYMATYAATKAFVVSLSLALAEELRGSGVRVLAACPGPVPTRFQAAAGLALGRSQSLATLTADETARRTLAAYARGRVLYVPGVLNELAALGTRVLPRGLVVRAAAGVLRGNARRG